MVSIRDRVHSGWRPFGMVSIRDGVHSGLCPFGIVFIRDCVHSGLCPFGIVSFGIVSIRAIVRIPILSAKKSPRKTSKAIHAALSQDTATASALPSQRTIRRRLFRDNLKLYKPAKKPKLSLTNIADRLVFCNKYQAWTPEQWKWVMFSDESQISQFYAFCRHIRRPSNIRNSLRYIIPTVKNATKVMLWGAICANGRCGLWFMPEETSINGTVYLNVLKKKKQISWKYIVVVISNMMELPATEQKLWKNGLPITEFRF